MTDPTDRPSDDPSEQPYLSALTRAVHVCVALVALLAVAAVVRDTGDVLALLGLVGAMALVVAYTAEQLVRRRLSVRREMRDAGLARTLQQMSRSISSDAIVDSVLDELRRRADADHIAIARLRPVEHVVEATLVSTRARVPPSRTSLPWTVLDPHKLSQGGSDVTPAAQRVADEIARRVAGIYGLAHTVAAPLATEGRILGAIVLSRRQPREWTGADRSLIDWSANELSAALARAFAFEEAENQANVDALTGLPNRRYLEELLATVGPNRRAADRLGVLMIDIDHFKRLNDRHGHTTGDDVLRAVAERISGAVRADDTPARYGGEEFVVLLRRATRDQAAEVAERIRSGIAQIHPADLGVFEPVTVSIGVAVGEARADDAQMLMEAADRALYKAKRTGRDRVVLAA